jgi:hypothetical protein
MFLVVRFSVTRTTALSTSTTVTVPSTSSSSTIQPSSASSASSSASSSALSYVPSAVPSADKLVARASIQQVSTPAALRVNGSLVRPSTVLPDDPIMDPLRPDG